MTKQNSLTVFLLIFLQKCRVVYMVRISARPPKLCQYDLIKTHYRLL